MLNTDRYTSNVAVCDGGIYYKSPKQFDDLGEGEIAHIGEGSLADIIDQATGGFDFTDAELEAFGMADTKASVRKELKSEYPMLTDALIDSHGLVRLVLDTADWRSASTVIAELWEDEEFQVWIHETE
jgi:hypothetical protein